MGDVAGGLMGEGAGGVVAEGDGGGQPGGGGDNAGELPALEEVAGRARGSEGQFPIAAGGQVVADVVS